MDKLKDFINQNRDAFEQKAPAGTWSDISKALHTAEKPKQRKPIRYWAVAASLVVGISIGVVATQLSGTAQEQAAPLVENEKLDKYSKQIETKIRLVKNSPHLDEQYKQEILQELNTLELETKRLMNDLEEDIDNKQVLSALIKAEEAKLALLNRVISRIPHKHEDAIVM